MEFLFTSDASTRLHCPGIEILVAVASVPICVTVVAKVTVVPEDGTFL